VHEFQSSNEIIAMNELQHVHLIGIGGVGVSGVARALLAMGYQVTGSDVRESQITRALRKEGATVTIGHDAALVDGADTVIYSTAVPETNVELVAAGKAGIPVRHRAEMLGEIIAKHELSIGVIGTHGKGTVASALAWIFEQAGRAPGFIIGGLLENFDKINARLTGNELLIAEVDESDGSLKHIHPRIVVINNLEADHLNYYDSLEHIQQTVADALNENERLERVIINGDCPGALALAEQLNVPVTLFGRTPGSEIQVLDVVTEAMSSVFSLASTVDDSVLGQVELGLPGLYNVDNALAAAACALRLDVPFEAIQKALPSFRGLENRFTVVDIGGIRIIKDYISHPTGIRRVLEAAAADGRPITAVFKPYRFTMVNYLQDDYAEAFHDAKETVITELYTAGEVPIPGIDTAFLCDKIRSRGPKVTYIEAMDDINPYLHSVVGRQGQVLFFGGDDLFELADLYGTELRAHIDA
jgi:UDP-N-acetylmuramate--alanine ligase